MLAELLERGFSVRVIARSAQRLPSPLRDHARLAVLEADLLKLDEAAVRAQVAGCQAVASCLGHRMNFRGIWGPPWRLVKASIQRVCAAIHALEHGAAPIRLVLMNTAGNRHRGLSEPLSRKERIALALLRLAIPPHADNEQAAEFLRGRIGTADPRLEWVAVRPDTLTEGPVSPVVVHPSPTRSALFDPGKTSRANVAWFMTELLADPELWSRWRGSMPVVYNAGERRPADGE